MRFFTGLRLLLLGAWIGAAVFFIGVAQSAFAILPTRALAGEIVNRNLMILNLSGIAISIILIVGSLIGASRSGKFSLWSERFLMLIVTVCCAIGQFVIAAWLTSVRLQMGRPIDEVAVDAPLRVQFTALHQYSVWVLMAAMIAALLAFLLMANRSFTVRTETKDPMAEFEVPGTYNN